MGIPNTILLQPLAFQAPSPPLACPGPTSNSLTAEASVVLKFFVVLVGHLFSPMASKLVLSR
jgi:hypothetical protein